MVEFNTPPYFCIWRKGMEKIKEKIIKELEQKDYSSLNIKELELISNIYLNLKINKEGQIKSRLKREGK
jgi:hypothetical protein